MVGDEKAVGQKAKKMGESKPYISIPQMFIPPDHLGNLKRVQMLRLHTKILWLSEPGSN